MWGKDREVIEDLTREIKQLRELIEAVIAEDRKTMETYYPSEKHTDEYWSPENILRRHKEKYSPVSH